MTQKICVGETLALPWEYQQRKKAREALQGYDYLLSIAPIAREAGRKITANISVIGIPTPDGVGMPYNNNPEFIHLNYLVHGDADAQRASFNMHNTFTLNDDDLSKYHEALDIFKYGVQKFREVFKEYLPALP